MSASNYKALAIRYRPKVFSEIVGHDVIKKVFVNAINLNRVHHAFLLTGTRGVGKTTIARILALSLNCSKFDAPTTKPCLECANCKQIIDGSHPDVVEFDAASKTGVDSVREIIDSSAYAPMMSRYKIYIIDEVHMLSKGAFNALLKTVEEPVNGVKFIFATTELRKVPVTIMSRCQKFILGNLSISEIKSYLEYIAKEENLNTEDSALDLIAKYANGSVRDALSLLDQVISVSDNKMVLSKDVSDILAMPEFQSVVELLDAVLSDNIVVSLRCASSINTNTSDTEYVVSVILYIISDLIKAVCVNAKLSDVLISNLYKKHEDKMKMPFLIRMWEMISSSMKNIKFIDAEQFLDMLCIKIIYTNKLPTPNEIINVAIGKRNSS
ncbi:MAG: DNA polymerase III subunit gamma/tau [Alphaproteobacteria bacterium]|nr:DNA polymerase III subunit gamma/tau [Rickettsiales bacterium]